LIFCKAVLLIFCSVWDNLQQSDIPPPLEDIGKWESQFNQLMARDREELDRDYSEAMQEAWSGGLGNYNENTQSLDAKFNDDGIPILPEYVFGEPYPRLLVLSR
jgi:peroxin-5